MLRHILGSGRCRGIGSQSKLVKSFSGKISGSIVYLYFFICFTFDRRIEFTCRELRPGPEPGPAVEENSEATSSCSVKSVRSSTINPVSVTSRGIASYSQSEGVDDVENVSVVGTMFKGMEGGVLLAAAGAVWPFGRLIPGESVI